MKKLIITLVILAVIGGGTYAYYKSKGTPEPTVTTLALTRGDVVDSVQATGTLAAVETVDVGTQVSGTVEALFADFNDIVQKGQVIARLDPSLLQTQIDQQRANVTRAEADLDRLRVNLADAKRKLEQAKMMWDKQLIPRDQLDTAELNVKTQEASIRSSEAGLSQTKSQLNTAMVNLSHTVIRAPITGIVISRSVDVGQTVQASMNAPTLYILAEDLTKMEVLANIDETDVGRIRPGQNVKFRVDAYPTTEFQGLVKQVRLQPTTVQNVVTYSTVIAVSNPDFKLKPGMTASPLTIEIMRKDNVLRAPNAALRFRPTNDMFAALKQPVPPEMQRGGRGGPGGMGTPGSGNRGAGFNGASGQQPPAAAPGATTPAGGGQRQSAAAPAAAPGQAATASDRPRGRRDAAAQGGGDSTPSPRGDRPQGDRPQGDRAQGGGRGGFANMTPEQREEFRKRQEERLKNMTPEERAAYEQRMRERGGRGGGAGREGFTGGGRGNAPGGRTGGDRAAVAPGARTPAAPVKTANGMTATTIDQLFAPVPVTEGRGRVWLFMEKQLKPVAVRTGISDGTWTEIIETPETAPLKEGTEVVTNLVTGLEPKTTPGQTGAGSPLMPQRGQPGRGNQPGGGGGRGR